MDRFNLHKDERHSRFELQTLLETSRLLAESHDIDFVLNNLLLITMGKLLVTRGMILFIESEGDRYVVSKSKGKDSLPEGQAVSFEYGEKMRESAVIEYNADDNALPPFMKDNSYTLFNLQTRSDHIGFLCLGPKGDQSPLKQHEVEFVEGLAMMSSVAIANVRMLRERIEKERLEEELAIARSIQQGLFPQPLPSHPRLDIAAKNVPSLQMGGDYFDILEAQQGNLLLAIGDVSGKGPSAALLMANLQAMLHVLLSVDISLEEATGRINDMIYQNTPGNKFVTFFWGLLNPETLQLWYVNAGHNPPLLFENSGTGIRELNEGGLILGAMPTMKPYRGDTAALSSGDLLACYTDGITEAMSEYQREEYGKERLLECIHAHHRQPSQQIIQAIIDDVEHFSDRAQQDDITLIVIKVK